VTTGVDAAEFMAIAFVAADRAKTSIRTFEFFLFYRSAIITMYAR
jgi:hypothetical protein